MTEPPADPRIPDLVSLQEAADILGLKRAMTHRLVQQGELRGRKIAGAWLFRRVVVEKLRDKRSPRA